MLAGVNVLTTPTPQGNITEVKPDLLPVVGGASMLG